jgi:hypothetical protein
MCRPGWKDDPGRTKRCDRKGGQNAVTPDTLMQSHQLSTKPGQVQGMDGAVSCGTAAGPFAWPIGSEVESADSAKAAAPSPISVEFFSNATHAVGSDVHGRASRITSTVVEVTFVLKYRANGTSVRTEIRGTSKPLATGSSRAAAPRLVDDLRTVRRRPSGKAKTR